MSSRWFHRGWTLQELIAPQPKCRYFYDRHWRRINAPFGPITEEKLNSLIQQKTRIPLDVLEGNKPLEEINIASKMRWAANRSTSREEDVAYSLMGLFNIQMTLRYGEGKETAFTRLQKKILKQTGDQSIFALADPRSTHSTEQPRLGLLAPFPECFDIPEVDQDHLEEHHLGPSHDISTWTITNLGLRLNLHIVDKGKEPFAKLCAYLGIMDTKTREIPTLELHQLGGNRYQRAPGLKFEHAPRLLNSRKMDLIIAFTTIGPRIKSTPHVCVFLPPPKISDSFSVLFEGHSDFKWTQGPDEDGNQQMICRYPVEEGGLHVASAKISVLSKLSGEGHESMALTVPVQDVFYLHCWLEWIPPAPQLGGLNWSVVWQISDTGSRSRPRRGTRPGQSRVTRQVASKQGNNIYAETWQMHAFGTENISICLSFVAMFDELRRDTHMRPAPPQAQPTGKLNVHLRLLGQANFIVQVCTSPKLCHEGVKLIL